MEQAYWLERTDAASAMAQQARCSQARLAHLELAGRYSIKAASAGASRRQPTQDRARLALKPVQAAEADAVFGGAVYYKRLETGARWLAGRAASATERNRHLAMANRYSRLRGDAAASRMPRS
jgi:hypothetical protein